MVNKRLEELGQICKKCVAPKRYPGCQDHCETGIERKTLSEAERIERYERNKYEHENRSYIRDVIERKRKRGSR